MDADQIIQTARSNLARLQERAQTQAAQLTDAASPGEYEQVRQALEACAGPLAALGERLAKVESHSQEPSK